MNKEIKVYKHKKNVLIYNSGVEIGTVHTWADGNQHKKTSDGWILIAKGEEKKDDNKTDGKGADEKQIKSQEEFDKYIKDNYSEKLTKLLKNNNDLNEANFYYRDGGYESINDALRGQKKSSGSEDESEESIEERIKKGKIINKYIEENPLKESITMFRGMQLEDKIINKIAKNKIFEPKNLFSLTTSESIALEFADKFDYKDRSNVIMKIKTKKNDNISPLVNMREEELYLGDEQEFIASYKNKYKINNIIKKVINKKTTYQIEAEVM